MRFYLDEDVRSEYLLNLLRSHEHDVLTTVEAGNISADDLSQLAFAAGEDRVFVTGNIRHLKPIAEAWLSEGKHHAGVAFLKRQRTDQANGNRLLAMARRYSDIHSLADQMVFP